MKEICLLYEIYDGVLMFIAFDVDYMLIPSLSWT